MKNTKKLSVEVLRDEATPDVDIGHVLVGLNGLEQIIGDLQLLGTDRQIAIADPDKQIDNTTTSWQRSMADLTITVTNRQIMSKNASYTTTGRALVTPDRLTPLGFRSAIISTYGCLPTEIEETTEHETAHMLNLKSFGETWDNDAHCADKGCKMHAYHERYVQKIKSTKFTERVKSLWAPKFEYAYDERSFCSECASQLGANAFNLLAYKHGKDLPMCIVFPRETRLISS